MTASGAVASDGAPRNAGGEGALIPLDTTGAPGLDAVLGGGIQRGSLVIVAGPPGAGKTILAHQIAFAAARAGRSVTILTAFAEPTYKLVAHMAAFRFFDRDLLGGAVEMLSIQQFLKQGLAVAADEVVEVVRAAKSQLVVLDGFLGVRESAEQPETARHFLYDVSNRLSVLGVTLLLTSEANALDPGVIPEAVTADVLLRLSRETIEARERRTLEALKVRGATPLSGRHALTIDADGVTISPRLEARVALAAHVNQSLAPWDGHAPAPSAPAPTPTATGFASLDDLLNGGVRPGVGLLVAGGIGAGKTLLSLQFALAGALAGEPALFAGFHETVEELAGMGRAFAWGEALDRAIASGHLRVLRMAPVELRADVFADTLLRAIEATGARRLALDGVDELEAALRADGYERRFHDFFAALHEALRQRGVVALVTRGSPFARPARVEADLGGMAAVAENVLWLHGHGRGSRDGAATPRRSLSILKSAASAATTARLDYTISPPGGVHFGAEGRLDGAQHGASPTGASRRRRKERRDDTV